MVYFTLAILQEIMCGHCKPLTNQTLGVKCDETQKELCIVSYNGTT